jgi:ATP-binding cassette subfamily C (CFTR/MRP) protein 4
MISSIWFGKEIKVETIFFLMNTLDTLWPSFKMLIPRGMHEVVKLISVLKRIERFLRSADSEMQTKRENKNNLPSQIKLSKMDVCVGNHKILENINLEINNGLTVLTGPMVSGKSLLFRVIMQEYQPVSGNLNVNGRISFTSQQPWLFPSTIKQNIMFGANYDEERYRSVLQVCAFAQDLECLRGGDGFIVADRGVNLSKGQQSRINLARAVYRDSEIYLLDDSLSNLDFLVADYVFEKCIKGFLKDKLVILTTQNPKYIRGADNTIKIINQRLELVPNMAALHCEHNNDTVKWKEDNCVSEIVTEEDIHETTNLISEIKGCEENMYQEILESGSGKFESYKKYVKFGGGLIMFTAICLAVGVVQFSKSGMKKLENNWSVWYNFLRTDKTNAFRIITEQKIINYTNHNITGNEHYINAMNERSQMTYLFPVALGMVSIITFLKGALHYLLARKASINFHTLLMEKVLNASMEFFSDHYLGHILHRFSEDLLYLDERVPYSLYLGLEVRFYMKVFSINICNLGNCRNYGNLNSDEYSKYDVSDSFIRILHIFSGDIYILFKSGKSFKASKNFQ